MQDLAETCEILYYVTQENIERSNAYHIMETEFTPECVICHPGDLERIRMMGRPLVDLREWKPVLRPFKA